MRKLLGICVVMLLCLTLVGCRAKEEEKKEAKETITVNPYIMANNYHVYAIFESTLKEKKTIAYTLTLYKDGKEVAKEEGEIMDFMPGTKRGVLLKYGINRDDSKRFDDYKLEYTTNDKGFEFLYNDDVKISDIKVDDSISYNKRLITTQTNTNKKYSIYNVQTVALFYKDGKVIGFDTGYGESKTLEAGESREVTYNLPQDTQREYVDYDKYEILVQRAYDIIRTEKDT